MDYHQLVHTQWCIRQCNIIDDVKQCFIAKWHDVNHLRLLTPPTYKEQFKNKNEYVLFYSI